jgi:geranylgeranyl pyrophosphate synthase
MEWFSSDLAPKLRQRLNPLLAAPAEVLWNRGGNRFRTDMARAGCTLWNDGHDEGKATGANEVMSKNVKHLEEAVELLHLGSLIIDDIQDDSKVRRNGPSVHQDVGVGPAIAVGNWLYFRALRELEAMSLPSEVALSMTRLFHQGIETAHHGQALDIGTNAGSIDCLELPELSATIARFKTGSLTMLAVAGGTILAGAPPALQMAAIPFGYEFGKILQQLNDLGNVSGVFDQERRCDDLIRGRASFVWKVVHQLYGVEGMMDLREAASQSVRHIDDWMRFHPMQQDGLALLKSEFLACKETLCRDGNVSVDRLTGFDIILRRIEASYE